MYVCIIIVIVILLFGLALELQPVTTFTQAANIMDTINFTCNVSGFPIALIEIDWSPILNDRITINTITTDNHIISILTLKLFQPSDAGLYKCTASLEGLVGNVLYNLTIGM